MMLPGWFAQLSARNLVFDLETAPEPTLLRLARDLAPARVREARRTLEAAGFLALAMAPADPAVPPEDPVRPACAYCGAAAPEHGLENRGYPGGPDEWSCSDADLSACLSRHDRRLEAIRELTAEWRSEYHPTKGYQGGPSWLRASVEEAEGVLFDRQVAMLALTAWTRGLADELAAEREAEPEAPTPAAAGLRVLAELKPGDPWDRKLGRNRAHTLGRNFAHTIRNPARRGHLVHAGSPPDDE